ncbi:hypothetical protein ADUPG1_005287, partial [Aduncisulcus paluster]
MEEVLISRDEREHVEIIAEEDILSGRRNFSDTIKVDPELRIQVKEILDDYWEGVDVNEPAKVPPLVLRTIDDAKIAAENPRPIPHKRRAFVESHIKELLDKGFIRVSESPFAAPIHVVPKGKDKWRMVVDYRKLNENLVSDSYPLPRTDVLFASLLGHCYYAAL